MVSNLPTLSTYLSQEILLAFFTSVAQGILALSALLVTIAIFRLERIERELHSASESVKQVLETTPNEHVDTQALLLFASIGYSKRIIEDSLLPNDGFPANIKDQVLSIHDVITVSEQKAEEIRKIVLNFTRTALASVGSSLCAILLTELLITHRYIALFVVIAIFGLSLSTLALAGLLVKRLMALGRWDYT